MPNDIFNDFVISYYPIDKIYPAFFILKIWTRKKTQGTIGADRTKISEDAAESSFRHILVSK